MRRNAQFNICLTATAKPTMQHQKGHCNGAMFSCFVVRKLFSETKIFLCVYTLQSLKCRQ